MNKTIEDNNLLLCKFLGIKNEEFSHIAHRTYINGITSYITDINQTEFNSSWDWVMVVVNKINSQINITNRKIIISNDSKYVDVISGDILYHMNTDNALYNTYNIVVSIIKLYYTNYNFSVNFKYTKNGEKYRILSEELS